MPKLCEYENCRTRVSGEKHFCKACKAQHPTDALNEKQGLFKCYSKTEYMNKFPEDPLTFQMLYKDKRTATGKYIDSRFDGFQGTNDREIQINGILLHICFDFSVGRKPLNPSQKYISIRFNTDKYECAKTGKMVNPMLYRRLPLLEEEINRQIERIVKGTECAEGAAGAAKPFIEIDSHL
jgi:hypothetical protein